MMDTVYEDTMTVTVEENNDPTVLALENAYTYFGLLDTDGKSVDTMVTDRLMKKR